MDYHRKEALYLVGRSNFYFRNFVMYPNNIYMPLIQLNIYQYIYVPNNDCIGSYRIHKHSSMLLVEHKFSDIIKCPIRG